MESKPWLPLSIDSHAFLRECAEALTQDGLHGLPWTALYARPTDTIELGNEARTEVRPASRATLERRLQRLLVQRQERQRLGPDVHLEADIRTLERALQDIRP